MHPNHRSERRSSFCPPIPVQPARAPNCRHRACRTKQTLDDVRDFSVKLVSKALYPGRPWTESLIRHPSHSGECREDAHVCTFISSGLMGLKKISNTELVYELTLFLGGLGAIPILRFDQRRPAISLNGSLRAMDLFHFLMVCFILVLVTQV